MLQHRTSEGLVRGFIEEDSQRIVFGWGRASEIEVEIERLGASRILLVSEGSTSSIADDLGGLLAGRIVARVPTVRQHVPREDADAATERARANRADLVLTVGGGSATGLGKVVALQQSLALLAVPTTYAGSEVTSIYGITHKGRKQTGSDQRVIPRTVLYDAALTTSLPPEVTASSGINAIAHCVEALYAREATDEITEMAEVAIDALFTSLPLCVQAPTDRRGRSGALYGAYLAGKVLAGAGMALHHRICHVLGGTFGLSHGEVNAVVLPHVVAFNEPYAAAAMARVAEALGADDAARALFAFAASVGAPTSLRELGMAEEDLSRAIELVITNGGYNPRPVEAPDVERILRDALDGTPPGQTN